MKGTLFSADFIKDADANLRLLELNTDTGFINNTLSDRFDFTDFISVLNSNSISELIIIYKSFQEDFVSKLEGIIGTDATFITTFTKQLEVVNTIYPTSPTDGDDKFILRLAYDENALFDSTYCKDRANVQKLFYDNSATGSIPEFYFSGSAYEVNTLRSNVNDHDTLPDFVTKPKSENHSPLKFLNIGTPESSSADRISRMISYPDIDVERVTIEKFHYNQADIDVNNNRVNGYRVVGIVYGNDIEHVVIGQWKVKSFFPIPTVEETADYITNNVDLEMILEDFEESFETHPGVIQVGDGLPTPTVEELGGRKCLKVVTSADESPWQNVQIQFRGGALDLTTSNKTVSVDVYSETSTFILMKVTQPLSDGIVDSSASQAHRGTGWETLDFDFSSPQLGMAVPDDVYLRIGFFPLWNGTDMDSASVTTTYYDNIKGLMHGQGGGEFIQPYDNKHYFQLTSNFLRASHDGVYKGTYILNTDNTSRAIETVQTGSAVKSIFINGLPDGDVTEMYSNWTSEGNSLPSGSYITSSIVESLTELSFQAEYGVVGEIKLSDDEAVYTNVNKHFLVYSTGSDAMRFKQQYKIDSTDEYLIDPSGSLVEITSNKVVILADDEKDSLYQMDVETSDAYFISSSVAPLIVHNCFIAGTMVKLSDGTNVAIEDIKPGDEILGYDEENEKASSGVVGDIKTSEEDVIIKVTLGEHNSRHTDKNVIGTTPKHPFFVKDKGWVIAEELEVGDFCFSKSEQWIEIIEISFGLKQTVYNLLDVDPTHTFYVNGILVHNKQGFTCFAAGTEISLANGDVKSIEDIIVGDEVLGWDGESIQSSIVTEIDHSHTVGSHADACESLGDEPSLYTINDTEIEFTPEHPFLTKEGWKSLVPDPNQKPYNSEQEPKVLGIGDYINKDGEWIEIEDIRIVRSDKDEPVYNIAVDKLHSYIANGIIVHNK